MTTTFKTLQRIAVCITIALLFCVESKAQNAVANYEQCKKALLQQESRERAALENKYKDKKGVTYKATTDFKLPYNNELAALDEKYKARFAECEKTYKEQLEAERAKKEQTARQRAASAKSTPVNNNGQTTTIPKKYCYVYVEVMNGFCPEGFYSVLQ
jgi:flagellar motility protein MotE (MotC chaperone)